ncbi:hypothetical protein N7465_007365 [Penicillium sp. CMV-2018d]|nr:hypothetical protein N7465_007365 [Penicillium sp. CMV-2018d]
MGDPSRDDGVISIGDPSRDDGVISIGDPSRDDGVISIGDPSRDDLQLSNDMPTEEAFDPVLRTYEAFIAPHIVLCCSNYLAQISQIGLVFHQLVLATVEGFFLALRQLEVHCCLIQLVLKDP